MLRNKCYAHALITAMISTQVLVGTFDLTAIDPASNPSGALSAIVTQADSAYKAASGGSIYTQDVALISQTSDGNYALIDQDSSAGTGSFSAIIQYGTAPSIAYIHQSGGGSMAVINQH